MNVDSTTSRSLARALTDLRDGFARRELWLHLGWLDVKRHYRRSILGPLWLTISMGMLVGGLAVLYSQILAVDMAVYLPNLATGLILWNLFIGLVTAGCKVFSNAGSKLRQIRMPLSFFVFEFIWSQLITFAHNFVIYIIIVLTLGVPVNASTMLALPGFVLVILTGFFLALLLGTICVRYRDVPMIIGSVMQVMFFITPIIWIPTQVQEGSLFLILNPFYHFLEITRRPLMGEVPAIEHWWICGTITLVLGIAATLFFARHRTRIAYWS
ncbi:MAG: ABC transporter permease [Rhizobiaceae bacterium]|jgi:ABC-2 type transport system permease protein/lipopolysaccharide transport system permease protein|nr:ABC transporter permease [Rhizobiaceae bacterium]